MALYLGNEKVKINLNGVQYCLNLIATIPAIEGIKLLSFDDYALKDSNELYLTAKEVG